MDCWDACSIIATVKENQISLAGNGENPVTGRFLCAKGRRHLDLLNHPQRLRKPLVRRRHRWHELSWTAALDLAAEKLAMLRERRETAGLVHYSHGGSMGLLKGIDARFFAALGPVSQPVGSLCQGAGAAAQRYDFGRLLSHAPSDCVNSKTIIIWGRNPAATNIHLLPFLRRARKQGAWIVLIDPLVSESVPLADEHVQLQPGTDGALALAMANVIISRGLFDRDFVDRHVLGFEPFRQHAAEFSPERAAAISGISREIIIALAERYAGCKPASIFVGYGLQRCRNGGNAVRAIDALGAISGNIGVAGGGVNYGHEIRDRYVDCRVLAGPERKNRTFLRPLLAEFLETAAGPPVSMIYTARANPLNQSQNSARLLRAFSQVDFKLTVDLFMSDTASYSDLVLPCRHLLEEEDVIFSHNYLQYCQPVVEPEPWLPSELWILNQLARRLRLEQFPRREAAWWLEQALQPLLAGGISLAEIKAGPLLLPGTDPVPWRAKEFETASGKIELWSERAAAAGESPLAQYQDGMGKSARYPYQLLTPHCRESTNSQHFLFAADGLPTAYIHRDTGRASAVGDGEEAVVATETGRLRCRIQFDPGVPPGIVKIFQGWWLQRQGGVNLLTRERLTDLGGNAAYYDCFCTIRPG